jgi:spoIIIJ-associated protein
MSIDSEVFKLGRDELAQEVNRFLEQLVRESGLELDCRCEAEGEVINIQLNGGDAGLVLSNNARALYAINHLLNQVFYRRSSQGCSFVVDCNGYRQSREAELQLLARKAAEEVRNSGASFSLQPLPASERRVIHLTLAEESGVRTESEGGGLHRRVVILPLS